MSGLDYFALAGGVIAVLVVGVLTLGFPIRMAGLASQEEDGAPQPPEPDTHLGYWVSYPGSTRSVWLIDAEQAERLARNPVTIAETGERVRATVTRATRQEIARWHPQHTTTETTT